MVLLGILCLVVSSVPWAPPGGHIEHFTGRWVLQGLGSQICCQEAPVTCQPLGFRPFFGGEGGDKRGVDLGEVLSQP